MPHGPVVRVMFVLFGTFILPIDANTDEQDQPHRAWRMNPKESSLDSMSLDDLLLEGALRKRGKL